VQKFLVIQTAFIGDVVLATALIEKLHAHFPEARIDLLVRKGNEALLAGHPFLHRVLVWDKKERKLNNLLKMIQLIRHEKYDKVINVQRFAATGLITAFSGAKETIGFDKNPLSRLFTRRIPHVISAPPRPGHAPAGQALHETKRNQSLISAFTDGEPSRPRLYPTQADEDKIRPYTATPYITISPASVWFTKQYPKGKWIDFIRQLPKHPPLTVYLLGAPPDRDLCQSIAAAAADPAPSTPAASAPPSPADADPAPSTPAGPTRIIDLSGQLSFLQSAALMRTAIMNYVNDSAPLHFASAVNAPVTAVYCSTIPAFGFGPLSDIRFIVETPEPLECRPCGLHGYKACPLGHFNCAHKIRDRQLLATLLPHIL
jgi:ADP-heptose:LPS heptosyltransferase